MRTARFFAPTLIALASLAAGDAPPLVDLEMPSLARTVERLEASPWGALYNDPAMAPMREQVAMFWAEAAKGAGMDAKAALLATTNVRFQFYGIDMGKGPQSVTMPKMLGQATYGSNAGAMWDKVLAKADPKIPATVAGADVAFQTGKEPAMTVARFKDTVVVGSGVPIKLSTAQSQAQAADMSVNIDLKALMKMGMDFQSEKTVKNLDEELGRQVGMELMSMLSMMRMTSRITSEGFTERLEMDSAFAGIQPVDRSVLARLPTETMMVLSAGYNGKALWSAYSATYLKMIAAAMSKDNPSGPAVTTEQVLAMGDDGLKQIGIDGGVAQLVSGFQGTVVVSLSAKPGIPNINVLVPRSIGLDKLVSFALTQAGIVADLKGITEIPVPANMVTPALYLASDATHWVLSTNKTPVELWQTGKPSGFLSTTAAKVALARAPATAHLIGLSNTPVVLKVISAFAGLIPMPNEQAKSMVTKSLSVLSSKAGTGSLWATVTSRGGMEMETQGLVGIVGLNPIISAMAFPAIAQVRVTAQVAQARNFLKNALHPAQVQFQAGAYRDIDGDGRGEYGFLHELAGAKVEGSQFSGALSLLPAECNVAEPFIKSGYAFRVFVPTSKSSGATSASIVVASAKKNASACDLQENFWVAYAWPVNANSGMMFAITASGVLYTKPFTGQEPTWNSLTGAKEWTTEVPATSDWKPYSR